MAVRWCPASCASEVWPSGGMKPTAQGLLPLHYLFATQGELGRAQFQAMTGLSTQRLIGVTVYSHFHALPSMRPTPGA